MAILIPIALILCRFVSTTEASGLASGFLAAGDVSASEVDRSLLQELTNSFRPGAKKERIDHLEATLRSMFTALPKTSSGNVDHAVVRYALHRLFVQLHGWYIKGLEPNGDARNITGPSESLKDWVPSHLQTFLEKRVHGKGFDLRELAVLAATIEDLVHKESIERMQESYKQFGFSHSDILTPTDAKNLVNLYLIVYLKGGNMTLSSDESLLKRMARFYENYAEWNAAEDWVRVVQKQASEAGGMTNGRLNFTVAQTVAEEVGMQFFKLNDRECTGLKKVLMGMEDKKPGRIHIRSFYQKALFSHWKFNEKVDYLRTLGALDESNPKHIQVILPNYVTSRPQCLEASGFYAVCCRNECEDLMGHLEESIAGPVATPQRLIEFVSNMSSPTTKAPRQIPPNLLRRLNEVAMEHGGLVPLHGRLFAQWMHHAFPRECPYPHQAGTTSPQTPDEWMRSTGAESSSATEEEMECHINEKSGCAGAGALPKTEVGALEEDELPWNSAEELLVVRHQPPPEPTFSHFNTKLRALVLAGTALGLATASRFVIPKMDQSGSRKPADQFHAASWWITLFLFLFPMIVVSADFILDAMESDAARMSTFSNELLVCILCWGLAIMMIGHLRMRYGPISQQKVMAALGFKAEKSFV